MPTARPTAAFTLIELLVVVSVIAILVALLMPAIGVVRDQARQSACAGNQRQIILAMLEHASGNDGRWPIRPSGGTGVYLPNELNGDYWGAATSQQSQEALCVQSELPHKLFGCPTAEGRRPKASSPDITFTGGTGRWGRNWGGEVNWPDNTSAYAVDPTVPPRAAAARVVLADRPTRNDGRSNHRSNVVVVAYADGHTGSLVVRSTPAITQVDPGQGGRQHQLIAFAGGSVTGTAINDDIAGGDNIYDGAGDDGSTYRVGRGSTLRSWVR